MFDNFMTMFCLEEVAKEGRDGRQQGGLRHDFCSLHSRCLQVADEKPRNTQLR